MTNQDNPSTDATQVEHSQPTTVERPPPTPVPEADPKLLEHARRESAVSASPEEIDDIFKVPPVMALDLLSAGIEALVNMTGDIPPTPPPRSPPIPHMRGMEAEKQSIVRSNSEKSLARLRRNSAASIQPTKLPAQHSTATQASQAMTPAQEAIDGVQLKNQPTQLQSQLAPYIIVGENSQPLNLQHSAITRKFYCRVPPPISITDYLRRIHRYCPMSTGVYLATSLYIHRLAVVERAIAVTKRNAHRLLLAGLKVAMKALEDLSYPHSRFAKVGGVSEREMARLEISFCFLTGFELAVRETVLREHWEMLRRGVEVWNIQDELVEQEVEEAGKSEGDGNP
ncbi:uncharacterized protein CTHT_0021390 [Thermochaetoides thermophila DSM 1495]|uniref:Cyclin-like protein n=1 Tax=Chaetomium thermophilum (strain DSM 1495 / CBS 144.50 / IMI 039719) TaxID=759272 RepID=G0S3I6_CHATD|nr:hypothetical protein CTHT_0021390 [Thermochaetoides thermophila DSM 1495]EGS20313.1 hypothetical protein CTHT_0021390 [Thermochaetoides thermophila DSM 1495]